MRATVSTSISVHHWIFTHLPTRRCVARHATQRGSTEFSATRPTAGRSAPRGCAVACPLQPQRYQSSSVQTRTQMSPSVFWYASVTARRSRSAPRPLGLNEPPARDGRHVAYRHRIPARRCVQRHQPANTSQRMRRTGSALPVSGDLDPDPVDRHQRREHLDLLRLGAIPLLLRKHRHVRPAGLHDRGVAAQVAAPAEARQADQQPAPAQVGAAGRGHRDDRRRRGRLDRRRAPVVRVMPSRSGLPSGAPCWLMNGTGSMAPAALPIAVDVHLEMAVRPGRVAAHADVADRLTGGDLLTDHHERARLHVAVPGDDVARVLDLAPTSHSPDRQASRPGRSRTARRWRCAPRTRRRSRRRPRRRG